MKYASRTLATALIIGASALPLQYANAWGGGGPWGGNMFGMDMGQSTGGGGYYGGGPWGGPGYGGGWGGYPGYGGGWGGYPGYGYPAYGWGGYPGAQGQGQAQGQGGR